MYNNRLIPCLLLNDGKLVKTIKFKEKYYIGDPLNAVRIFNDKEVDELIFLDIFASKESRKPNFKYLEKIAERCFMPLCYGGGITSVDDIRELFRLGFEKVALNSSAYYNMNLIKEATEIFGGQSIVGSIDVGKNIFNRNTVKIKNGKYDTRQSPTEYARKLEQFGIGEVLLNSISHDGTMQGYDCELIKEVSNNIRIPLIACGGAGKLEDCKRAIESGASAAAAGSLFTFWGLNHSVLINYPNKNEIETIFNND